MSRYRFKIWRGTERWWRPWRFEITGPYRSEQVTHIFAKTQGRCFSKKRAIKEAKSRINFYEWLFEKERKEHKTKLETVEWHDG